VLDVAFHLARPGATIHDSTHELRAAARIVTEPFVLSHGRSNVEIRVTGPGLDQGRFGVEGLLVNEETGETRDFWLRGTPEEGVVATGGSSSASVRIGGLAAGAWRMRLDPRLAPSLIGVASATTPTTISPTPSDTTMRVVVAGPFASNKLPIVLMLLLCVPPILIGIFSLVFEAARWQQSDHAG